MNTLFRSFLVAMSTGAILAGCIDDPTAPSAATSPDDIAAVRAVGRASAVANAASAQTTGAATIPGLVPAHALASRHADMLVASRPAFLHASPNDAFAQMSVASSGGVSYVAYERTHLGLPVIGGDFVLVIDGTGQITYQSVAQQRPIDIPSITPTLSQGAAESIAARQLLTVTGVEGTQLVVNALGDT